MPKAKVTVIVPVYNAGEFLNACLDSVLSQTLKSYQIICVNDGSTDNSYEILKKYENKITLLQTDKGGASVARNRALELANGTYTLFLDADDTIPENYIESLYQEAKNSKADIVITGFNYIHGSSSIKFKNPLPIGIYKDFSDKLKSLYNGALWNKLFKTSLIKKNNLTFEEGRMWEDNLFVVQALYYSKIVSVVYEPCYNYRVNEDSVTNNKDLKQKRIEDARYIYMKTLDFIKETNLNEKQVNEIDFFLKTKAMPNYVLK